MDEGANCGRCCEVEFGQGGARGELKLGPKGGRRGPGLEKRGRRSGRVRRLACVGAQYCGRSSSWGTSRVGQEGKGGAGGEQRREAEAEPSWLAGMAWQAWHIQGGAGKTPECVQAKERRSKWVLNGC